MCTTCREGFSECAGNCVDTDRDPSFCGDCETDCGAQVCSNGECADTCQDGQQLCGQSCTNLDNDPLNCGECGNVCGVGQGCNRGDCQGGGGGGGGGG